MEARCLLVARDGTVSLDHCLVPGPGANELLVETLYSCVSPGTEARVLVGQQPLLPAKFYPVIPGYALAGRVIACGAGVPPDFDGAVVTCAGTARASHRLGWGGHISHAVVPTASAIIVPPQVDPLDAVLAPLAAIAWRGVRLAQPTTNDTVAVLGLGVVGQLSVRLFAHTGVRVIAGGLHREQIAIAARTSGVEGVLVERDSVQTMRKRLGDGATIVVDATGNPAALRHAVELAATKSWDSPTLGGPRLVLQGSYLGELGFPHQAAFERELTVLWPRFFTSADLRDVVGILAAGKTRFADVITEIIDHAAATTAYRTLCTEPRRGKITVAIRWATPVGENPVCAPAVSATSSRASENSPSWWRRLRGR